MATAISSALTLHNCTTRETKSIDCQALFIFIGVAPRTEAFAIARRDRRQGIHPHRRGRAEAVGKKWDLDRDPLMFETSVPGVFAAGDVRANANRRIAAAVGEGSAAIFSIHQYLRSM